MNWDVLEEFARVLQEGRQAESDPEPTCLNQMRCSDVLWNMSAVYQLQTQRIYNKVQRVLIGVEEGPGANVHTTQIVKNEWVKEAVFQNMYEPSLVILARSTEMDIKRLSKAKLEKQLVLKEYVYQRAGLYEGDGLVLDMIRSGYSSVSGPKLMLRSDKECIELCGNGEPSMKWEKSQWEGIWGGEGRGIYTLLANARKFGVPADLGEYLLDSLKRRFPSAYAAGESEVLKSTLVRDGDQKPKVKAISI